MDYGLLVNEQKKYINKVLFAGRKKTIILALSSELRQIKRQYNSLSTQELSNEVLFEKLYQLTNTIDKNKVYRMVNKARNIVADYWFVVKNKLSFRLISQVFHRGENGYLAIVCIVKNEASYMDEWIAFYKLQGVDHIFLFNNSSADSIDEIANKWSGFVSLIDFPGRLAQLPAYRLAAHHLKDKFRWVAFIDADEFMFCPNSKLTLKDFFTSKEKYDAIGINWIVYGPGNNEKRPEGLVIENYFDTFEDRNNVLNLRIKCVVNPKQIYDVTSPHYCILKNGKYAVDENGIDIDTRWMFVSNSGPAFTGANRSESIRINHYWTKSKQELAIKCNRGYAAGGFTPNYDSYLKRLDYPLIHDDTILPYVEQVYDVLDNLGFTDEE